MRILLTNDDGIHDEGMVALEKIARELSDDIWIVAPDSDQSGMSHSITLSHPMRLREFDERRFSVKGTPSDCVIMALRHIMPEKPDLILSGVNSGTNIADDATYSGTIAAAMEGCLSGVRSIALSQAYNFTDNKRHVPYDVATTHGSDLLRKIIHLDLPERTLLNVNFPNCAPQDVAGVLATKQGSLVYGLGIEERKDGRGFPYYWLRFGRKEFGDIKGTDIEALQNKNISVSPLRVDLTQYDALETVAKALR